MARADHSDARREITVTSVRSVRSRTRGDYTAGVNLFDSVRNRGETTTYSQGWFAGASYRIIPVISLVGEMAGDCVDLALTKHLAGRLKLDFPLYATFGDVHKGIRMSLGISMPVGTR